MWQSAHDAYIESRILSASPIELVGVLYQGAIDAVREARRHLAAGNIRERSRAISQAVAILAELSGSLDHARGGEVSTGLARLYDYMRRRLTDANFQQSDGPLAEVLGLLATLSEAWEGVRRQHVTGVPEVPGSWAQPMLDDSGAAAPHLNWSL